MERIRGMGKKLDLDLRLYELHSLLKEIDNASRNSSSNPSGSDDDIGNLGVELRFLKTFIVLLSKNQNNGYPEAKMMASQVSAGFKESKWDFRNANSMNLDPAISRLREKFTIWRPQVKAAYDFYESRLDFQHDDVTWIYFANSLEQNMQDLLSWNNGRIPSVVVPKLEALKEMLGSLRCFVQVVLRLSLQQGKFRNHLTVFGAGLVRAARVCYISWVDINHLDERMAVLLSDLIMNNFKPRTPVVIEGCLEALMVFTSKAEALLHNCLVPRELWSHVASASVSGLLVQLLGAMTMFAPKVLSQEYTYFSMAFVCFCRFLCPEKYQVETLHHGLTHLLLFVWHLYFGNKSDAIRLLLVDIVAAFDELGSHLCNGHATTSGEIDPSLNKLLQKIMLLVVEVILETFNPLNSVSISMEQSQFDSIEDGLLCLCKFLGDEIPPSWTFILHLVSTARSVSDREGKSCTIYEGHPSVVSAQLFSEHILTVRILKMEIMLKEFLDRFQNRLLPDVKKQIERLHEELMIVTFFLAANRGSKETLEEAVLIHVFSTLNSFLSNKISADSLRSFSLSLRELLERVELISTEIKGRYLNDRNSLPLYSSTTPELGSLDFLKSLRSFLKDLEDKLYDCEHADLRTLISDIVGVASQVEYISDSLLRKDDVPWYYFLWLSDLIEDMKLIKVQISKFSEKERNVSINNVLQASTPTNISQIDEVVVDLVDEHKWVIDRLTRGSSLQLDVTSIVGMGGIGKTTLARKVYNDPAVTYHFHQRAWCCVTQFYQKRKLLLEILGGMMELTTKILEMNYHEFAEMLYRCLKGKRYLIVLDDIWSIEAWNDLQKSFRDDKRGSRILITSRLHDVAAEIKAFMEDKEITVCKLIRLWTAEGFIQHTGAQSIEGVAEEYLSDLIGRNLVMASKRKSNGRVKTCRVHDMVTSRDEAFSSYPENLFLLPCNYSHPEDPVTCQKRRVSFHTKRKHFVMSRPVGPHVHSLLCFATSDLRPTSPYEISFIPESFKRLRVLDLECINMGQSFLIGIGVWVCLRYLALSGDVDRIPDSLANLRNLQTFVFVGLKGILELPATLWSMEKLQHLHVKPGAQMKRSAQLLNLVSLSSLFLSSGQEAENILGRLPKLQRLTFIIPDFGGVDGGNWDQFPELEFLNDLESLKVLYSGRKFCPRKFDFPLTLRKLTLSEFHLQWDCVSEIGKLPNIEVLKLHAIDFDEKIWDMEDVEFSKLTFLKLDTLNIVQWNACADNLPRLRCLVVQNCRQLEEVPSGLGYIPTLEVIEVQMCQASVEESVKKLKQEQQEWGNEELEIIINHSHCDSDCVNDLP
ncbi:OLC1v1012393C1 [Oldenlandia corymbosa var. corymbosa]|uniref:OLC1v1012393C1 n=1 Tax=Oldenlandia corymbosa var. corymbosa TaxID=529605 RepID=A0AAV1DW08_OLDCO|nr:OLC1v1012393C1 [Oldenlandia corymbosa var. corymbosa]